MRWLVLIAALLPALALGGGLVAEQWPLWNAPNPGWLDSEAAPGACEAVASLRAFRAARASADEAALTPLEARKLADRLIQHQYDLAAPPARVLPPLLVRASFPNDQRRLAWLVTAALGTADKAAIVYLDDETGSALALITDGAAGETARCTLDPAALLRRAVRTLPALALAGYTGLLLLAGAGIVGYRLIRMRLRPHTTPTA